MRSRTVHALSWQGAAALAAVGLWLIAPVRVSAQAGAGGSSKLTETPIGGAAEGLPATSIAPAEAPAATPTPKPRRRAATTAPRRRAATTSAKAAAPAKVQVEPAKARLRLKEDTPIYAEPTNKSRRIEQGQSGKFVMVSGATHYYLRVKLKSGQEGYVLANAVDLVAPVDKIFMLTHDAPVLDAPNRWGKKLSEVHQGHAVHVVGVALNYMKIRMRSGLEGFIPITALE
jgi:hypothetical protein